MIDGRSPGTGAGVSHARRVALLAGIPAFAAMRASAAEALAAGMREERAPAGGIVVQEEELGDRLYVIAEGRAEVSVNAADGPLPLAALGPGEMFGEVALLSPGGRRTATVTAITDMLLLSVSAENFDRLLREYPQVELALQTTSEMRLTARFLKQASPFTTLEPSRARWLATKLERRSVAEGREIVREGDRGDACYLLKQGEVEVVMRDQAAGGQRQLARLGPGALFGEAALLTQVPRNATVRAVAPCELLVLRRADLLEAMASDDRAAVRVVEQVGLHDRPRQVAGVISHQRAGQDGETITTLKHPHRGLYHRVGDDGWFVWQQLDGQHTLEEVSRDYRARFAGAPPQALADIVRDLTAAGLVDAAALRTDVVQAVATLSDNQPKRGFFRHLLQRKG